MAIILLDLQATNKSKKSNRNQRNKNKLIFFKEFDIKHLGSTVTHLIQKSL